MKGIRLWLAVIIVVAGVTVLATYKNKETNNTEVATTSQVNEISYQGEDGKTALDIAKEKYNAQTTTSSFGEYVTSLNGVAADASHFWGYYINGQMASVGAGEYQTKSSDLITWRLETIQ